MSTTLATLVPDLAGRVEETNPNAPVFWSLTYEFLPSLVDAMFEAALITGTVQAINITVRLAANTTYFALQNNTSIGIPAGVIAALRLRLPWPIRKTSLKGLSDIIPGWQNVPPATSLRAWFPLGTSAFGIFPQLSSPQQAVMDFIVNPVNVPRPYNTAIGVPFQDEFTSAFPEYAAVMLRAKELGLESEAASTVLDEYMSQMKALSMFQNRLDQLVLTNTYGGRATVNRREVV
jgi:hypothetical protein